MPTAKAKKADVRDRTLRDAATVTAAASHVRLATRGKHDDDEERSTQYRSPRPGRRPDQSVKSNSLSSAACLCPWPAAWPDSDQDWWVVAASAAVADPASAAAVSAAAATLAAASAVVAAPASAQRQTH